MNDRVGVGLVGCGYVADFYMATFPNHPQLQVLGATDVDKERARRFSGHHNIPVYDTLDDLLRDDRVSILVNLTNPKSHFDVSNRALRANKHVYSEKPLALDLEHARSIADLAKRRGLHLASAPCSILGEAAQTIWRLLRGKEVGEMRAVYANLDDGAIYQMGYGQWRSLSGLVPWPYEDEFQVGCVLEHAGYYLTWLMAFFGPVEHLAGFSACLVPEKVAGSSAALNGQDFSVAVMRFQSGVAARVTVGTFTPNDHRLELVGEGGVISVDECWNYGAKIRVRKRVTPSRTNKSVSHIYLGDPIECPLVRPADYEHRYKDTHDMDFARGIAEVADAVRERRDCRLSTDFSLHLTEVALAIDHAGDGVTYRPTTTFSPMKPMPWAK